MAKRVKIDNLTKEILNAMEDYIGTTEYACEVGVYETAEYAVNKLHSAHPSGSEKYGSWKKYNADWTVRKNPKRKRKGVSALIYNKKHYQLTHLLEKGHAKRGGGRTRAFPHILPVEQEAERMLLENIKKEI